MSSEIMARLSLDESRFESGIDKAERRFEAFGQKVRSMDFDRGSQNFNKAFGVGQKEVEARGGATAHVERTLERGFGAGELLKAGMRGFLGFATIETAVELVRKHYERIAEVAKNIARDNERGTAALERVKAMFRSDPQKLAELRGKFKTGLTEFGQANAPMVGGIDSLDDREKAAKIAADLRENLAQQAEIRKRMAERRGEASKRVGEVEKQIDEEKNARAVDGMDLDEKIFHQQLAQMNARKAMEIATTPLAKKQAELALEKSITEEIRLRGEVKKQQEVENDARLKQDEAENREGQKNEARRQREVHARLALGQAETDLSEARAGRTQITLGDAVSGKRGTRTEQIQAKRIADLEKRALRVRDMGGQVGDDKGHFTDANTRAQQLMDRAGDLRKNMSGLTPNDREPFKDLQKSIDDSKAVLEQIRDHLEPESLD